MPLSEAEAARYARHLSLPGFVPVTQEFLRAARVHVVGAGEVAGPALLYLAAAGVGTLLVDDPQDLGPEDAASWLYGAGRPGEPRVLAAMAAVRAGTSLCKARPYATGSEPTAALVCAASPAIARAAAAQARLAGLPHVVALADGDDGEVVTVPAGAPCYQCATRLASGMTARPGASAAALGALAALELVQLLAGVADGRAGRRIDLEAGMPQVSATVRVAACACGRTRKS
ncbi:HesA/MoeB/ThiF family protein [Anaeromyxobacter paludicola]|uniref:Thiazole biosynthesis adenylyltransferase ThiF n=1 Tax=Anaeromyxobacter paludicola TaxID=2918171 RepID=A0ABN6NDE5_9BACT|nr:ThiF family adenylyltransferase [Anaeromyxobacter paludicola]BDG10057.1 thiazole biosynthesis adenylyltransferase ThiF [Anaeromyxobacter paludicola]